jgi:hypothetical protein
MPASFDSAINLVAALRGSAESHGRHDEETGHPDPDRPDWYAQCPADEQSGRPGESSPGASA